MDIVSKKSCVIYSILAYMSFVLFYPSALKKINVPLRRLPRLQSAVVAQKYSRYLSGGQREQVTFQSKTSAESDCMIEREAILVKRPGAKATVLVCHGYMCDKIDTGIFRMMFHDFNVMTFDFRAHGAAIDESQYCTFGKEEANEVIGAAEFIKSDPQLRNKPVIAYGFSMGAVATITAQSQRKDLFDALVLDCPYDRSENLIKNALNHMKLNVLGYEFDLPGRSYLEAYAFSPYVQSFIKILLKTVTHLDATKTNTQIYPLNPVESVKNIAAPCFFIHCNNDEKVPVSAGKLVYENAQGYKRMWVTNGRWHFDSFFYNPEKYMYKVNKFIDDVLTGKINIKHKEKLMQDDTDFV